MLGTGASGFLSVRRPSRRVDSCAANRLAIGAEGFLDLRILAVILAAVPGVASDDWIPEPKGAFGLEPRPGEILYSTLIPPEVQRAILDEFPADGP